LKLRKVKRLILENQSELEKIIDSDEQIIMMQTHQHLKQMEMELTRQLGTVIYK
jgi:DNA primase